MSDTATDLTKIDWDEPVQREPGDWADHDDLAAEHARERAQS